MNLTRVLEATMNSPQETGSRRQTDPRRQPHQEENDVTGGTAAIFHAGTAPRQRYQGLIRLCLSRQDGLVGFGERRLDDGARP